jgi:hypothetical protein
MMVGDKEVYTCVGKGGRYMVINVASPAGVAKELGNIVTYQDIQTGIIYYRLFDDFCERMTIWTEGA